MVGSWPQAEPFFAVLDRFSVGALRRQIGPEAFSLTLSMFSNTFDPQRARFKIVDGTALRDWSAADAARYEHRLMPALTAWHTTLAGQRQVRFLMPELSPDPEVRATVGRSSPGAP